MQACDLWALIELSLTKEELVPPCSQEFVACS
jgi:hypothetical protein